MILDTNALSAWLDGDAAIGIVLSTATYVALSSIVMGEYRYGVMFSRHRSEYEQQLSSIELDLPVISVCYQTAKHYAAIRKELKAAGSPIPWHDLWIAAQSRQHDLPVLSRDNHFDNIEGVTRLSW